MLSHTSLLDFGRALCSAFFLQYGVHLGKRRNQMASDRYTLTVNPADPVDRDARHGLLPSRLYPSDLFHIPPQALALPLAPALA